VCGAGAGGRCAGREQAAGVRGGSRWHVCVCWNLLPLPSTATGHEQRASHLQGNRQGEVLEQPPHNDHIRRASQAGKGVPYCPNLFDCVYLFVSHVRSCAACQMCVCVCVCVCL